MSPSRRDFLATSVAAALGGSVLRPLPLAGRQSREPQAVFTPLRRNVGTFAMRGGTIGWMVDPDAVVVVDSQFPPQAQACIAGLNERSGSRPVDWLVNTHHHGDHTGGNIAFRGVARAVVAQTRCAEDMHDPPGGEPPEDQLYPDVTFATSWASDAGDEKVTARYYGRAHTSGDIAVTFEQANVVHMGDLVFHRRHPVVDRAAGATMRGWAQVLDAVVADHAKDTIYIFGHAAPGLPPVGTFTDVLRFRDYLNGVVNFAGARIRQGHSPEEVLTMRAPLAGFEEYGPFGRQGAREALTCAVEEVTQGA